MQTNQLGALGIVDLLVVILLLTGRLAFASATLTRTGISQVTLNVVG